MGLPEARWSDVWNCLAESIGDHLRAGRGHLLTEDVVRFTTIGLLGAQGIGPDRLAIEYRVPGAVRMGQVDLVVDPPNLSAAVEFKFPRDPANSGAADTMTVGELVNDFYRLARLDARDRWAVQVIGARLARHLRRRTDLRWTLDAGSPLRLVAEDIALMPMTARRAIIAVIQDQAVTATCVTATQVDDLVVAAYRIDDLE